MYDLTAAEPAQLLYLIVVSVGTFADRLVIFDCSARDVSDEL